jgi:ADP-ribosylglycohydrolase
MGCGGVMRTAPIGLVYAPEQAFAFGCGNAALTHGHDNGIAPAGMHARLIALLRGGIGLDEAVQEVVSAADGVPYAVGSAALLRDAAALAQQDFSREQLSGALGEGWVGHEALAIAVACALRHRDDPARAIWAAANHPGDSDSTASIAGQILGAAGGIDALPAGWLDALELRAAAVRLADLLAELRPGNVAADELWPDFPGY